MSILASLRTGVYGLAAQGEALSVIGDNIANANTTGFKASRAEFQDIVAKSLKGLFGGNQIGRGVKLGVVNPILSQGNKHFIDVYFRKDQDRQWTYYSVIDGKEVVGQEEGKSFELSKGKLTFTSDVISWSQDGNSAGTIMNFSFDDTGVLTALYSNGEAKNLFKVGIAKFESPESLFKIVNNRFRESIKSGTPSICNAGEGGRGKVFAKSLERSTVDLALEFVNMIQNQRGFQANSKIITTTDELLGEIINMKR